MPSDRPKRKLQTTSRQATQINKYCKWSSQFPAPEYKTQWWSFSTPNFFHGSESFLANSFWYFTCFPIKIPTRVIWWRVVFWKDASEQRNVGLNSNYWGNILYIYQLRVSLRQTFLLCKSLSTTMTLVTVSLRRAQWHDGPTQGEMLRESARAAVLGRADARQVYLCVIITDC